MLNKQNIAQLDWVKTNGIIPTIIQHAISGQILMHAYMNKEALKKTLSEGKVTFWSRTKKSLWTKGETSNYFLNVVNITPDCDHDTLLVLVKPIGPTCHTGHSSCFYPFNHKFYFLYKLERLLEKRKHSNPISSYTASLYASGTKRIAQKIGEEGIEVALAAMSKDRNELISEASDLLYHLLVLLQDQKINLSEVISKLSQRQK